MTDTIPEYWPEAESKETACTRPLTWLGLPWAMLAILVSPARIGPRISNTTWTRSVTVCLFSILSAMFIGLAGFAISYSAADPAKTNVSSETEPVIILHQIGLTEIPYLTVASTVSRFHAVNRGPLPNDVIISLLFPASYLLIIPLGPLLFMPLISTPLRITRRYTRCLQLLLWTSVLLIPTAFVFAVSFVLEASYLHKWTPYTFGQLYITLFSLAGLWLISLITKLGRSQPAGSFSKIRPRCTGCGYIITGIPIYGKCPECSQEIYFTLPDFRRRTDWATATLLNKPAAYLTTALKMLFDKDFFKTINVQNEIGYASSYALTSLTLASLLITAAVAPDILNEKHLYHGNTFYWESTIKSYASILTIAAFFAIGAAVGGLISTLITSRFCKRDPQPMLVVGAYASAGFLFIPFMITLTTTIRYLLIKTGMIVSTHYVCAGVTLHINVISLICGGLPTLAVLIWVYRIYNRGIKLNRYTGHIIYDTQYP